LGKFVVVERNAEGRKMSLKRAALILSMVCAGMLFWASAAWACTSLASLNLSSATGNAGDTIHVNGSSFSPDGGSGPPVVVHWNGTGGPVLATIQPDATGTISGAFQVPQAAPGLYVVVATQTDGKGGQAFGTPARAGFQILSPGAGQPARAVPAPVSSSIPASSSASAGLIALTAVLGVIGLALFGVGVGAFARQARRRSVPSAERINRA
jgi:hypothetical protein